MKKSEEIKRILKEKKSTLSENFHVKEIGIFGSSARGEDTERNDIDIWVEFQRPIGFFKFLEIEGYLERIIERKIDLVKKLSNQGLENIFLRRLYLYKRILKYYGIGLVLSLIIILFSAITEVAAKKKEESKGTLSTTAYLGPKKRVAILNFEVKAPGAEDKIGSSMAEMLITALHNTDKYIVLERESQSFKDMLKE